MSESEIESKALRDWRANLKAGNPVVICGAAAHPFERIVRPVDAVTSHYLTVEGRKYRRHDGWEADVSGFDGECSWIEPEPSDPGREI